MGRIWTFTAVMTMASAHGSAVPTPSVADIRSLCAQSEIVWNHLAWRTNGPDLDERDAICACYETTIAMACAEAPGTCVPTVEDGLRLPLRRFLAISATGKTASADEERAWHGALFALTEGAFCRDD